MPIKHVVFLVKENRTFNNYFGTYPGAVGSTTGRTFDSKTVPITPAHDVQPHDITHGFASGMYAIDGGKMDGFNIIKYGEDLSGYVQFKRGGLPNYWSYADHFTLADHFFTSMFGPTFPEHLYAVAAQADGITDNKETTTWRQIHRSFLTRSLSCRMRVTGCAALLNTRLYMRRRVPS